MNFQDYWAAEYSVSGACFHVDRLSVVLDTNAQMAAEGQSSDYQIFGIFRTSQEANTACDEMVKKQAKTRKQSK